MKLLNMKRLVLLVSLGVLSALPARATSTTYINNSSVISPPAIAPQIDATNFVNNGNFSISLNSTLPFETWNTRNWTNNSQMTGNPGFRFDYFHSIGQTNGWSANFQNSVNANIYGADYLLVYATNINNKGTLSAGVAGLLSVNGKSINLTRSTVDTVGNAANQSAGVEDIYWGVDLSNTNTSSFTSPANVTSSPMLVTEIQPPFYDTFFQELSLTTPFKAYSKTTTVGDFQVIDVLLLRTNDPSITTEVRFSPLVLALNGFNPGVDKIVRWQGFTTNRVTGVVTTNEIYLEDSLGATWDTAPFLVQSPNPSPYSPATFHPDNYTITHTAPALYNLRTVIPSATYNPTVLPPGTNSPEIAICTAYAATLTSSPYTIDSSIAGSTYTNLPGRIELTASGPKSSLDLTRTFINGQSYLLLSATNHFVGCTNAVIVSPVSDFYLASTNGTLAISNLVAPLIPCLAGQIQVWSGRWTNVTEAGLNTFYNVTMIDSVLTTQVPSKVQNMNVSSTNLLIGDIVNVFGSLFLDTTRLTISTNLPNAPTSRGELNLTSGDIVWSPSLPKLQSLTNFGKISTLNTIYFAGARTPPWFSGTFDEPYQSFVTHGPISSVGCGIWANYYEASGTNNAGNGPISAQAGVAIVTNGTFLATGVGGDISFTCGDLTISNQILRAGRGITLTVTNKLDDGSLSNSVDVITGKNIWTVNAGINLLWPPTNASLLGTTVTNTAASNSEVVNYWAGQDRGGSSGGFVKNGALGRLILDGKDSGSLFTFLPTGRSNALYVDLLEIKNATTNFVTNGVSGKLDLIGVNLDPNFTIYYAQAIAKGQSIAEKLNGAYGVADTNGGRFCWVSNYSAGFWSSSYVVYSDGTTNRLNAALVQSCTIDSNGNGVPNCSDTNPIPVLSPASLALTVTFTNVPPGAVELSWNSIPYSTNYVFFKPSALAANWRLLTTNSSLLKNPFVLGPTGGRQRVLDPVNTGALYRVRVDGAAP
jgi:hypothetical protein